MSGLQRVHERISGLPATLHDLLDQHRQVEAVVVVAGIGAAFLLYTAI
jgi:hypothetical protein